MVTGSNGLVGSAIRRFSLFCPEYRWEFLTRDRCDLTSWSDTYTTFINIQPNYVIHCAAVVGGVGYHQQSPSALYRYNTEINNNTIAACSYVKVEKLLAFSSVCAFPNIPVLKEDLLHEGEPSEFCRAYGHAKRQIDTYLGACRQEFGFKNWCCVLPVNICGINDFYNEKVGHVIPSLIAKFYNAMFKGLGPVQVFGDGSPKREFIDSDDLARVCFQLLSKEDLPPRLIISSGIETSIKEIVDYLIHITCYSDVTWGNGPNGVLRRPSDISLLKSLGLECKTDVKEMLGKCWYWYLNNYDKARK